MWVIRLLESFAWVVCVTDLLMCPSMTHTRLSLFRNVKTFSQETFWDCNIPDGLNCSINFGRVTFEDEQLPANYWQQWAEQDKTGLWLLPLRKLSWASLTLHNTFRSGYGYGLRVPGQAPTFVRYRNYSMFDLSDSPILFPPLLRRS